MNLKLAISWPWKRHKLTGASSLDNNTILYINDVFDASELDYILETHGLPRVIVSDHVIDYHHHIPVPFIGLPLLPSEERNLFSLTDFDDKDPQTRHCANFMINKHTMSRYLLLKFVEIFNLTSFEYTWSGLGRTLDLTDIINEHNSLGIDSPLDEQKFTKILAPVELKEQFVFLDGYTLTDTQVKDYGGNDAAWYAINDIFCGAAVSLISESLTFQKASVFTEKTLYSVYGLTFPIWIGGYAQAETFSKIGFDVFNDVINHDYQYYDTLLERCYYAFELNKKILTDLQHAAHLRQQCLPRLKENRNKIFNGIFEKYIWQQTEKWSDPVKSDLTEIVNDRFLGDGKRKLIV